MARKGNAWQAGVLIRVNPRFQPGKLGACPPICVYACTVGAARRCISPLHSTFDRGACFIFNALHSNLCTVPPLRAVSVAAALACLAGAAQAPTSQVGLLSTLSGPGAALADIRDGFNLAVKHAGGKIGGLPRRSDRGRRPDEPRRAKQTADRLIKRDKVDFMRPAWCFPTSCWRWASPFCQQNLLHQRQRWPQPVRRCAVTPISSAPRTRTTTCTRPWQDRERQGLQKAAILAPNYPLQARTRWPGSSVTQGRGGDGNLHP